MGSWEQVLQNDVNGVQNKTKLNKFQEQEMPCHKRGQKKMSRLVWTNKATVTQIITFYNHDEQKKISECTTLRWMSHNSGTIPSVPFLSAKTKKRHYYEHRLSETRISEKKIPVFSSPIPMSVYEMRFLFLEPDVVLCCCSSSNSKFNVLWMLRCFSAHYNCKE